MALYSRFKFWEFVRVWLILKTLTERKHDMIKHYLRNSGIVGERFLVATVVFGLWSCGIGISFAQDDSISITTPSDGAVICSGNSVFVSATDDYDSEASPEGVTASDVVAVTTSTTPLVEEQPESSDGSGGFIGVWTNNVGLSAGVNVITVADDNGSYSGSSSSIKVVSNGGSGYTMVTTPQTPTKACDGPYGLGATYSFYCVGNSWEYKEYVTVVSDGIYGKPPGTVVKDGSIQTLASCGSSCGSWNDCTCINDNPNQMIAIGTHAAVRTQKIYIGPDDATVNAHTHTFTNTKTTTINITSLVGSSPPTSGHGTLSSVVSGDGGSVSTVGDPCTF